MDENGGNHKAHRKTLAGVIRKHSADNHHVTTNLRDLLKGSSFIDDDSDKDKSPAGEKCTTLANDDSPSSFATNRTFFDVKRDGKKHSSTSTNNDANIHNAHNKTQIVNWKTFKNRLLLRHAESSFSDPLNIDTVLPSPNGSTSPVKVSLMTLLNQTDMMRLDSYRSGEGKSSKDGDKNTNTAHPCNVCKDRHKDTSVLPCGHAFCNICSTELSSSAADNTGRGSKCPLCNGFVLEILNIF